MKACCCARHRSAIHGAGVSCATARRAAERSLKRAGSCRSGYGVSDAMGTGRFVWMIAGKVLLFSESAMIRAPYSLGLVRPHRVLVTPDVADCSLEGSRRNLNAQQKSAQCREMNAIQCKLARVALNWGVRELAEAASVSTQTITRLENGEHLRETTLKRVRSVLENAGIEFIPENGGGVGVRFKNRTS